MPRTNHKLTPYQRIMRAAAKGAGVRLSAEDVKAMAGDDAVITLAGNDDAYDEYNEALD